MITLRYFSSEIGIVSVAGPQREINLYKLCNSSPWYTLYFMDLITGQLYFLGKNNLNNTAPPHLEIHHSPNQTEVITFTKIEAGQQDDNTLWLAQPTVPAKGDWHFKIKLTEGKYHQPLYGDEYITPLQTLWVQDHQVFSYQPTPTMSSSRVIKTPPFTGSMPARALYIYLPRGYDEHTDRFYPVIHMHDGQNCFEAFADDSFAGSWQADLVADRVISQGQMQEVIIVGVSNGQIEREAEYLPPYTTVYPPPKAKGKKSKKKRKARQKPLVGRAGQTLAYYRYEVAPYIQQNYRALVGRENTATCGSSMGGLFTTYIAWERTEFAQHHAALSPSYWITRTPQGKLETVERLRTGQPRDIRLWLDSGTLDAPGRGDDGCVDTLAARKSLLENGYVAGPDFQYYLDKGATHTEAAWAARLDKVFRFLFPEVTTQFK